MEPNQSGNHDDSLNRDIPAPGRARFAMRGGMLLGLVIFALNVAGLILLENFKSRLGGMSPSAAEGWITYEFMDDHFVALSLAWTGLCVAAPSLYWARRRQWRRLAGMLIVMGPALLVLLGFVLYAIALSSGMHAVTG